MSSTTRSDARPASDERIASVKRLADDGTRAPAGACASPIDTTRAFAPDRRAEGLDG